MNILLFLSVFSLITLVYVIIGLLSSKKIHSTNDYFLANRDLGLWQVTFTLIATQLGGGMLLGTSQQAYLFGWYGILYTLGMSAGFFLLSTGLAARLQQLNVATTAEIFQTYYYSPFLHKVASALSIATMCGLLIGQVIGSKMILHAIGMHNEYIFLGFWLFVILYTMIGGLKAVVATDIAQVVLIVLIFCALFIYHASTLGSTFFNDKIFSSNTNFSTMSFTNASFIATLIMPALFSLIEQDLAQRFFAARTQRIATLSALFASLFMILFSLVPIYFGMQAKLLNITIPADTSPLMIVLKESVGELPLILAFCSIIAAITSTADSLLCAISSNIAQDFNFSFLPRHNALKRSQFITLVVGIIGVSASYYVAPNIIDVLINSYALSVASLLVPLLFVYTNNIGSTSAAYASVFTGAGTFFAQHYIPQLQTIPLLPVMFSLAAYALANYFFPAINKPKA